MQKILMTILCLYLCFGICFAEVTCACQQEYCTCFIQLGDGGPALEYVQHALIAQGYLLQANDAYLFDEATLQAVLRFQEANSLPTTGTLDDVTLTLLLWNMLPDELDNAAPASNGRGIWIPTEGGIRRHINPTCSNMSDPRLISVRNADFMDFQPCGKCNRGGKKE